jgi:hypothetical protein
MIVIDDDWWLVVRGSWRRGVVSKVKDYFPTLLLLTMTECSRRPFRLFVDTTAEMIINRKIAK